MDEALTKKYDRFLRRMNEHYECVHGRRYIDQDMGSMSALGAAVLYWRPEWILEVGTGHGGSTYAMVEAINYAKPPLEYVFFQTVDRNPEGYQHMLEVMGGLDGTVSKYQSIKNVGAPKYGRGLIFWDAHDDQSRFSLEAVRILDTWSGPIMTIVHDCWIVDKATPPLQTDARLRVTTVGPGGGFWTGRAELIVFLQYCQLKQLSVYCTAAGLTFFHQH